MLTKKELMDIFGISIGTVNNYMKQGMPYHKMGVRLVRFKYAEVEKWIKNQRKSKG